MVELYFFFCGKERKTFEPRGALVFLTVERKEETLNVEVPTALPELKRGREEGKRGHPAVEL